MGKNLFYGLSLKGECKNKIGRYTESNQCCGTERVWLVRLGGRRDNKHYVIATLSGAISGISFKYIVKFDRSTPDSD